MRLRLWVPLIAFAGLLLAVGLHLNGQRDEPIPSPLVGKPLPDFSLARLDGGAPLTRADLAGKVTILNVFGSWCVACVEEHPQWMAVKDKAEIYGIAWRDEPGKTREWLARRGNPYVAVGLDPDSRAAVDLGVTGAPETYVIGRDGRIALKIAGPVTPVLWRDTLAPLLRELAK